MDTVAKGVELRHLIVASSKSGCPARLDVNPDDEVASTTFELNIPLAALPSAINNPNLPPDRALQIIRDTILDKGTCNRTQQDGIEHIQVRGNLLESLQGDQDLLKEVAGKAASPKSLTQSRSPCESPSVGQATSSLAQASKNLSQKNCLESSYFVDVSDGSAIAIPLGVIRASADSFRPIAADPKLARLSVRLGRVKHLMQAAADSNHDDSGNAVDASARFVSLGLYITREETSMASKASKAVSRRADSNKGGLVRQPVQSKAIRLGPQGLRSVGAVFVIRRHASQELKLLVQRQVIAPGSPKIPQAPMKYLPGLYGFCCRSHVRIGEQETVKIAAVDSIAEALHSVDQAKEVLEHLGYALQGDELIPPAHMWGTQVHSAGPTSGCSSEDSDTSQSVHPLMLTSSAQLCMHDQMQGSIGGSERPVGHGRNMSSSGATALASSTEHRPGNNLATNDLRYPGSRSGPGSGPERTSPSTIGRQDLSRGVSSNQLPQRGMEASSVLFATDTDEPREARRLSSPSKVVLFGKNGVEMRIDAADVQFQLVLKSGHALALGGCEPEGFVPTASYAMNVDWPVTSGALAHFHTMDATPVLPRPRESHEGKTPSFDGDCAPTMQVENSDHGVLRKVEAAPQDGELAAAVASTTTDHGLLTASSKPCQLSTLLTTGTVALCGDASASAPPHAGEAASATEAPAYLGSLWHPIPPQGAVPEPTKPKDAATTTFEHLSAPEIAAVSQIRSEAVSQLQQTAGATLDSIGVSGKNKRLCVEAALLYHTRGTGYFFDELPLLSREQLVGLTDVELKCAGVLAQLPELERADVSKLTRATAIEEAMYVQARVAAAMGDGMQQVTERMGIGQKRTRPSSADSSSLAKGTTQTAESPAKVNAAASGGSPPAARESTDPPAQTDALGREANAAISLKSDGSSSMGSHSHWASTARPAKRSRVALAPGH